MAKNLSPPFFMVVVNGVPMFRGYRNKAEADAKAEKWQGSYAEHRGLLKHKDKGDWVEVRRDYESEREYNERVDDMQRGNPQRIVVQYDTELS